MRSCLEEVASSCNKYLQITKSCLTGPGSGKTKLDKERIKLCQREIVNNSQTKLYSILNIPLFVGIHWKYVKESESTRYEELNEGEIQDGSSLYAEITLSN